jgi:hypothetical protein
MRQYLKNEGIDDDETKMRKALRRDHENLKREVEALRQEFVLLRGAMLASRS